MNDDISVVFSHLCRHSGGLKEQQKQHITHTADHSIVPFWSIIRISFRRSNSFKCINITVENFCRAGRIAIMKILQSFEVEAVFKVHAKKRYWKTLTTSDQTIYGVFRVRLQSLWMTKSYDNFDNRCCSSIFTWGMKLVNGYAEETVFLRSFSMNSFTKHTTRFEGLEADPVQTAAILAKSEKASKLEMKPCSPFQQRLKTILEYIAVHQNQAPLWDEVCRWRWNVWVTDI